MANVSGWQGLLYYGTAGSQAATQITKATDVDVEAGKEYGDHTSRGAGTNIPVHDARPTKKVPKLTFKMVNDSADTALAALIVNAQASAPTPLAFLCKDRTSGNTLLDADCYLTVKNGQPLNGEQTYEFEATPTTDGGRAITC